MRNFVWRSWTSSFFRDKSSDETTSQREPDALFVYRKPPPRRPTSAYPASLPPEVVDADSGDEHRPGVLGLLRQPRVELRAERGEACPAALGELRGIERDREGRVLSQEGEVLADDEPLDRAVLRPFR